MKYLKLVFLIVIISLIVITSNVYAHPGRTDSSGCHYCRTNCSKWGLYNGEYHCHNGGSSSSNSENNSGNSNDAYSPSIHKEPVIIKSNNTNIKTIKIDNKNIEIEPVMTYETDNDDINIEAIAEHRNAEIEISDYNNLEHGINKIIIAVTAEDGTEKEYLLKVALKNNDNTIKEIKINDETINVNTYQTSIEYETYEEFISIEVIANDEYADVFYDAELELKVGENKTQVVVVAENGDEQEYQIYITRLEYDESEEIVPYIIWIIIGGIIGFIVYKKYNK